MDPCTQTVVKKVQQRLFLLWKLQSFCFHNSLSVNDNNSLHRFVLTCSKVIGTAYSALRTPYNNQTVLKVSEILRDDKHVPLGEFLFLPSSHRSVYLHAGPTDCPLLFRPCYLWMLLCANECSCMAHECMSLFGRYEFVVVLFCAFPSCPEAPSGINIKCYLSFIYMYVCLCV